MALLEDLRECGNNPISYAQETHGQLHLDALAAFKDIGVALAHPRFLSIGSINNTVEIRMDRDSYDRIKSVIEIPVDK